MTLKDPSFYKFDIEAYDKFFKEFAEKASAPATTLPTPPGAATTSTSTSTAVKTALPTISEVVD
jgi:hypothetical protein